MISGKLTDSFESDQVSDIAKMLRTSRVFLDILMISYTISVVDLTLQQSKTH